MAGIHTHCAPKFYVRLTQNKAAFSCPKLPAHSEAWGGFSPVTPHGCKQPNFALSSICAALLPSRCIQGCTTSLGLNLQRVIWRHSAGGMDSWNIAFIAEYPPPRPAAAALSRTQLCCLNFWGGQNTHKENTSWTKWDTVIARLWSVFYSPFEAGFFSNTSPKLRFGKIRSYWICWWFTFAQLLFYVSIKEGIFKCPKWFRHLIKRLRSAK